VEYTLKKDPAIKTFRPLPRAIHKLRTIFGEIPNNRGWGRLIVSVVDAYNSSLFMPEPIQLALQGGGAKVIALMAAMEALENLKDKVKVTRICGTSADP
jgi:predicted acylesterase/phospholipase RssA